MYYITDRSQFPGGPARQRQALVRKIGEAAGSGVDYVQLREKDLPIRDLELLAREAVAAIAQAGARSSRPPTRLLINSRTDVALACGADGVHLRSDDCSPAQVRAILQAANRSQRDAPRAWTTAVSCHSLEEVARAAAGGADFVVYAPVFEKRQAKGVAALGLESLRQACRQGVPVFALGGVDLQNAHQCEEAGARGIAAIRLFQQNPIAEVVDRLG